MSDRRYVTTDEMAAYGKATCRTCNGTGRYFVAGLAEVCRCAERRFWARHAENIGWTDDGSKLFWKDGRP